MTDLLSFSYWFELSPRELMPLAKTILAAAFGLMLLAGIGLRILAARAPHAAASEGRRRLARLLGWMGAWGLLLVWFAHELIYFFGARFWFLAWLIVGALWLFFTVKFMVKEAPFRAGDAAERARINKWLPKNK